MWVALALLEQSGVYHARVRVDGNNIAIFCCLNNVLQ
jgi:hypothetical protein